MKAITVLTVAFMSMAAITHAGPKAETSLKAALDKAKSENKLLFVQMGREECGNCQALKGYIQKRSLRLPESQFVWADIPCDDAPTNKLFRETFKVEGRTLPFVVIASPDGTQLASHSGYGTVEEYESLLKEAKEASKSPPSKTK